MVLTHSVDNGNINNFNLLSQAFMGTRRALQQIYLEVSLGNVSSHRAIDGAFCCYTGQ